MTELTARIGHYLGLIRFSHTIFAMPFAIMAIMLAWNMPLPDGSRPRMLWRHVAAVLIAMVAARTAAMAVNRLLDQSIDAANPRTSGRHLPAGLVSRGGVVALTVISALIFVASSALFLPNWIPLLLSAPVLAWLMGYSLAKRFTALAHVWLGVALALSPICVWLAIRGVGAASTLSDYLVPGFIALVVATWVTGFDVIYACQDAEFDRDAKLHSIPSRLGIRGALRFACACHAIMIPMLIGLSIAGQAAGLGSVFWIAIVIVSGLAMYQHRLVRPDDLSRVGKAFFETNAIISVVLVVATVVDCYWI